MVSNNMFFGNNAGLFIGYDAKPVFGDPGFASPGDSHVDGYRIANLGSPAIDGGISFTEPEFPMAGKGIFKDIPPHPVVDLYGNPVNIGGDVPNIGAFNGKPGTGARSQNSSEKHNISIYPNPVQRIIHIDLPEEINGNVRFYITTIQGVKTHKYSTNITLEARKVSFPIDANLRNGIYNLIVESDYFSGTRRFVLVR